MEWVEIRRVLTQRSRGIDWYSSWNACWWPISTSVLPWPRIRIHRWIEGRIKWQRISRLRWIRGTRKYGSRRVAIERNTARTIATRSMMKTGWSLRGRRWLGRRGVTTTAVWTRRWGTPMTTVRSCPIIRANWTIRHRSAVTVKCCCHCSWGCGRRMNSTLINA